MIRISNKTVSYIKSGKGDSSLGILWNVKVFLQSLLVGLICGFAIFLFVLIGGLAMCDDCIKAAKLFLGLPFDFFNMVIRLFLEDLSPVKNHITSSSIFFSATLLSSVFYLVSLKFRLNLKTVHLIILSVLLVILIAILMFSVVVVDQYGLKNLDLRYLLVAITLIFFTKKYISYTKISSDNKVTTLEILIISLLNTSVLLYIIFVLTYQI